MRDFCKTLLPFKKCPKIVNFSGRRRYVKANYSFRYRKSYLLKVVYMSTRRSMRLSTENFVCCSRNAILCACKISRSFADHPSKILISELDKFYTGFTMIIQKNRRVRTSRQNLIHFAIRCHREKYLSTLIKYRRFQENIKNICWPAFYYTLLSLKERTLTKVITMVAATNH